VKISGTDLAHQGIKMWAEKWQHLLYNTSYTFLEKNLWADPTWSMDGKKYRQKWAVAGMGSACPIGLRWVPGRCGLLVAPHICS
jgi:hypothetical protein